MPAAIKYFIREQLKAEPENPGRFFTKYKGDFKVNNTDLLYKFSFVVNGMGDETPSPQLVIRLFNIIQSSLQLILDEITEEEPGTVISPEQVIDITASLIFKLSSCYFENSVKNSAIPLIEHQTVNVKSRVFINIAQRYYIGEATPLEEIIAAYYQAESQKVFTYLQSVLAQIDPNEILIEQDIVEKLKLDANANFRGLPIIYKYQIIADLWSLHLASKAQANPYPITFESFEYVMKNKAKFQTAVEVVLLNKHRLPGNVDYAQGFEQGNTFHDVIETQLIDRLVQFAKTYLAALAQTPDLQEEGRLTAAGEKVRDNILNEINAQQPLPAKLASFMTSFGEMNAQLSNINDQLQKGSPFAKGSEEHTALQCFYDKVNTALSSLKSAEPIKFPDGLLHPYKLSHFRNACEIAFKEAEESVLSHHSGWWANVFKPLLITIGICCTGGLALLSETVRNYAYAGFFNISKETAGMESVLAVQTPFEDMTDETYEDLKINYGIYAQ